MINLLKVQLATMLIFTSYFVNAQDKTGTSQNKQSLFPKGTKVTAGNFTGTAWVHGLIASDSVFNIPVASVTFEPGARTRWHTHGGGQALIAIDGIGYYQEKGKAIQILRKGDAVKCPPDTPHWHGASPEVGFTQIAITPNVANGRVTWLQPVTEEEYRNVK